MLSFAFRFASLVANAAVIDIITGNKNVIQTTSGTIASIGIEQAGKKVAGALVTPAIWFVNYGDV